MNSITNSPETEKYQPIVFVNNPITNSMEDVIGFDAQVETIQCAIDNGANMIGIIADYGSGKSSLAELLSLSEQNKGNPPPIKINMWDCLSNINNTNKISENVSTLTKSFLYQLSNGHSAKLGKYVNKILSKNYGSIALAINDSKRFWLWFVIAGLCYTIYQISNISGTGIMKHLPEYCDMIASGLKLSAPIFAFGAIIAIILGMKDAYIAFSHWNMANRREPEINDVFDTYNIIIEKIKPEDDKKQLIFIDDLDRINKKKLIVEFLKELYRFQDSLGENKDKFVFIISIKPESELKEDKDNNDVEDGEVYSKIFDLTLSLKPIHFDDYDSILLKLLKNNPKQKNNLEKLIEYEILDILPESFKWIKRGTNLNLRDLKERLNQALSIMISLKNKNYQVKTAVNFEACTAVAYLENKYPNDYYDLIKCETEFAEFIQTSRPFVDISFENKKIDEIQNNFNNIFNQINSKSFNQSFVLDLCGMVISGLFTDDFRMYFYTYPKGSHIKTTAERTLCNYLLFPNSFKDYEKLDEIVEIAFENGENTIVKKTVESLSYFPPVLLENDTLFLMAVKISFQKTYESFLKTVVYSNNDDFYKSLIWERTLTLQSTDYKKMVSKLIAEIIEQDQKTSFIINNRKTIILGLREKILDYKRLYNRSSRNIPQITKEEISLINNIDIVLQLVDINTLEGADSHIISAINSQPLIDTHSQTFKYACKILNKFTHILSAHEIGKALLDFLNINQYLCNSLFDNVAKASLGSKPSVTNNEIADYLNQFSFDKFSEYYLDIIDKLGFEHHLSEHIINGLLERNYYYTPLLFCAWNDCLDKIERYSDNVEKILTACKKINEYRQDAIIKIRTYLCDKMGLTEYENLYKSPYPLMTNQEYLSFNRSINPIKLIDFPQITEENYESITEAIHNRNYLPEELIELIKWIFDEKTNKLCLSEPALRKKIFNSLDLKKLGFSLLDENQRDEIYETLEKECDIRTPADAISFLRRLGCLIPKVEKIIQQDEDFQQLYCELISDINDMTSTSTKWFDEFYISCGLSEKLCEKLYEITDYQNYIIAETLRNKFMIIHNDIPFDNYIVVYINSDEIYDIMSEHWDFCEKLQDEADFSELNKKRITPIFKVRQTERFFNYIFSDKTSDELKVQYLKEFGSFREEKDSKAFQKLICQDENMELLGSWNLYHRIHNLLWASHPGHKGAFTRAWNKRWRDELS